MLQWWQMPLRNRKQNDDERWKLEIRQGNSISFRRLASRPNMNPGHWTKTNGPFQDLKESMWILNQVVIDLYSRVWELLHKLLWKQRFPVYTSCVGNRLPRVLPRVPASCSCLKWAVPSTFKWKLRPPTSLPLKLYPLFAFLSLCSLSFCIQKEYRFVIDWTFAYISSRFTSLLRSALLKPDCFLCPCFLPSLLYRIPHAAIKERGKYMAFCTFWCKQSLQTPIFASFF